MMIKSLLSGSGGIFTFIFIKNYEVHLTHMEIALLELLMEEQGQIVSYETIEERLYRDKEFNKDSLRTLLSRLRKKLGGCLIFSHPDIGYRLVVD